MKRFLNKVRRVIRGHFWTVMPTLAAAVCRAPQTPGDEPFLAFVEDPRIGPVRLSGIFRNEIASSDTLLLIIHGLSGSAASHYCAKAADAAQRAGLASLRLSLRGADTSGEDILHGGIVADIKAALAAPQCRRFSRIMILGYSVGGHVALRAAIQKVDPRIAAVAAICPPLDLAEATRTFDRPSCRIYRRHVFAGLNRNYRAYVERRKSAQHSFDTVARARSCEERDSLTVVPRFGYRNAADYYQRESVRHHLHRLEVPSLLVASADDPIIPWETVEPSLASAPRALQVRLVQGGGHITFPRSLDLGMPGRVGLEDQAITWLTGESREAVTEPRP